MALICGACPNVILVAQKRVKCTVCTQFYHAECVNFVPESPASRSAWKCPGCLLSFLRGGDQRKTPTKADGRAVGVEGAKTGHIVESGTRGNSGTPVHNPPVRVSLTRRTPPLAQLTPVTPSEDADGADAGTGDEVSMVREMQLFRSEMAAMRHELSLFGHRFESLLCGVEAVNKRLDCIEDRVVALEERAGASAVASDAADLLCTVEQLKAELNDRDQDLLAADAEITGIPEVRGENPVHLVCRVAEKLGVPLEDRDVVSAERVEGADDGEMMMMR